MFQYISQWSTDLNQWYRNWGVQEWFLANVLVLVLGALMLRGFGSRKDY